MDFTTVRKAEESPSRKNISPVSPKEKQNVPTTKKGLQLWKSKVRREEPRSSLSEHSLSSSMSFPDFSPTSSSPVRIDSCLSRADIDSANEGDVTVDSSEEQFSDCAVVHRDFFNGTSAWLFASNRATVKSRV